MLPCLQHLEGALRHVHQSLSAGTMRKNSAVLLNLTEYPLSDRSQMLCTGIPELRSADDCEYLRMAFGVGLTDDEAAKRFTQLIHASLRTKTTILNDAIHVWVHS